MARSIHITTARAILNSGDPVDISVWKANGEIMHLQNCISLRFLCRYSQYKIAHIGANPQNQRLLHL